MQTFLLLLLSILPGQLAVEPAKNLSAADDEALRASVAATAKEFAKRCEFTEAEAGHAKLALHTEPILRWSNPTAGKVFGEVFVWTDSGRPAVIGCWYRWFSPDWGRTFEVCSLSEGRLAGRINDNEFWNSAKPGLALKPLKEVDAPARLPAARLVQMRRLAADFVANLADTRGNEAGVKRELRLLPQPVFRHLAPKADSTYLDGALFAFVEGTDPEAFLLLEATKTNDDVSWQYGLVRMNRDALRINFRDKEVWTAPYLEKFEGRAKEPYALFTSEPFLDEPAVTDKQAPPKVKVKP